MTALLVVLHSINCVLLIFLVLLHSVRTPACPVPSASARPAQLRGSTAIVEKNLDRITVVSAILFAVTTFLLARTL